MQLRVTKMRLRKPIHLKLMVRAACLKIGIMSFLVVILLCFSPITYASTVITLDTRPGVTQKLILIKPNNPVASVILFAGGKGDLQLSGPPENPSIGWGKNNFLIRTREDFANHGLMVAVVDAPSDRKGKEGMLWGFRTSNEHLKDMEAVIAYLSMALEKIKVPTLIVAHEKDKCWATPPQGAEKIKKALINAPKIEVRYFSGGNRPQSRPCGPFAAHGFFGIEKEVVATIVDFIKSNSQKR